MIIERYNAHERDALRRTGLAAAGTLMTVAGRVGPGVTTAKIDRGVRDDTAARGGAPSQIGYHGFPTAVCTSRHEVVCHGIPSRAVRLREGDIVNVDVTTKFTGFHPDCSATFAIGAISEEFRHLLRTARASRGAGVAVIRDGARLGDIGAAVQELGERAGCSVVREYGGHGIGRVMDAPPTSRTSA